MRSSTTPRVSPAGHGLRLLLPLSHAGLYLLLLDRLDSYEYMGDTCMTFQRLQEWFVEHHHRLTGNPFFEGWNLGPLADLLLAIPMALSRNMLAPYYFLWSLYLLSIPLFYLAVLRRFRAANAAMLATYWFTLAFIFPTNLMITPWNTSFLPLFLALFALALYTEPKGAHLLLLYGAIGLCLQLHMTAITLIPASFVFLWRGRKRFPREWGWHLGGLTLILLLHASVIWAQFLNPAATPTPTAAKMLALATTYQWSDFFLNMGLSLILLSPLLLLLPLLSPRTVITDRILADDFRKLGFVLALQILSIAFIGGLKRGVSPHYYLQLLPFLAYAAGAAATHATEHLGGKRLAAALALPVGVLAVCYLFFIGFKIAFPYVNHGDRLSDNVRLVRHLRHWLDERQIEGPPRIHQSWYVVDKDRIYYRRTAPGCLDILHCLEYPESCHRPGDGRDVHVFAFRNATEAPFEYAKAFSRSHWRPSSDCVGPLPVANGLFVYYCIAPEPRADGYCGTEAYLREMLQCEGVSENLSNTRSMPSRRQ